MPTDWSHSCDEHAAAYTRAGLPHWAAQCLSEPSSPTGAASQTVEPASQVADPVNQTAASPVLADRPSAIVQATISDVLLTLPHDQDFGRAERFVELWSKAFGQVELSQCCIACSCSDADYVYCCNTSLYTAAPPTPRWCPSTATSPICTLLPITMYTAAPSVLLHYHVCTVLLPHHINRQMMHALPQACPAHTHRAACHPKRSLACVYMLNDNGLIVNHRILTPVL